MNILILGYSSIVKRKVLPTLIKLDWHIDIASKSVENKNIKYNDYEKALEQTKAEIVYISLVNVLHEKWIEKALLFNKHVIVDKPATLSFVIAEKMVSLAKNKGLLLAESIVFNYHSIFKTIMKLTKNKTMSNLQACFSFPPLAKDNFRYNPELGGGAFLDLAPYASSVCRYFFKEKPQEIICRILEKDEKSGLELSFSIMVIYKNNQSMIGYFGFNSEYQNNIKFIGEKISFNLDRAFTIPDNIPVKLVVNQQNKVQIIEEKSNTFLEFFLMIKQKIKENNFMGFYNNLLNDSEFLEQMRKSAK